MVAPYVLAELADNVLWLTPNRPAQRNPLCSAMIAALTGELDAAKDDPAVRVIVITGAGPVFSAGHDLRELHGTDDAEVHRRIFTRCSTVMQRIDSLPQGVIARVNGVATARASPVSDITTAMRKM